MIISPNENGWSFDESVKNWKLVYSGKIIIFYEKTDQAVSTQEVLFVGTEQECEEQIKLLDIEFSN